MKRIFNSDTGARLTLDIALFFSLLSRCVLNVYLTTDFAILFSVYHSHTGSYLPMRLWLEWYATCDARKMCVSNISHILKGICRYNMSYVLESNRLCEVRQAKRSFLHSCFYTKRTLVCVHTTEPAVPARLSITLARVFYCGHFGKASVKDIVWGVENEKVTTTIKGWE